MRKLLVAIALLMVWLPVQANTELNPDPFGSVMWPSMQKRFFQMALWYLING